jgi:hypothetical protein
MRTRTGGVLSLGASRRNVEPFALLCTALINLQGRCGASLAAAPHEQQIPVFEVEIKAPEEDAHNFWS